MKRVFDGRLHVRYHSASLFTPETDGNGALPDDCFAEQTNGLCGAMVPGMLMFTTGLHHGGVGFTVDVADIEPPLDNAWEEIVEVSFFNRDEEVRLCDFYGLDVRAIPLASGTYRVRYCARGMSKGSEEDTLVNGDPVDFYSLTFWPAPPAPDAILKQTTEFAAYWHQAYKQRSLTHGASGGSR